MHCIINNVTVRNTRLGDNNFIVVGWEARVKVKSDEEESDEVDELG